MQIVPEKGEQNSPHVVVRRVIPATRERVFQAWTDPVLMSRWLVGAPGHARATVDLKVGGAYSVDMVLDPATLPPEAPKLASYLHTGKYIEIVPPERLVFTWESHCAHNSVVTVELHEVSGGTEVSITHRLSTEEECLSHEGGWTFALSMMAEYLLPEA